MNNLKNILFSSNEEFNQYKDLAIKIREGLNDTDEMIDFIAIRLKEIKNDMGFVTFDELMNWAYQEDTTIVFDEVFSVDEVHYGLNF